MQVTKVNAWVVQALLQENARGIKVAGFTTRPGYGLGLMFTARDTKPGKSGYVGF